MERLEKEYDVRTLCRIVGVSRSGYYKWKNRVPGARDPQRGDKIQLVFEIYSDHKTHGYRWIAAFMRNTLHVPVSNCYVYKCCRYLGITAQTRHKWRGRRGNDGYRYPNLICDRWDTVSRPRQVIVSDMTALKFKHNYYEITFYFDVFTKEILAWRLAVRRGAREQYVDGLKDVVSLLTGCTKPTVLHTDRGSVYSSKAYNDLIKDTNIIRSMSRPGTPTDNPVNESLNGWIKEELMSDFNLNGRVRVEYDEMNDILKRYVDFYNHMRPCYAIGYDTPANYYRRYCDGAFGKTETFCGCGLKPKPKNHLPKVDRSREKLSHDV